MELKIKNPAQMTRFERFELKVAMVFAFGLNRRIKLYKKMATFVSRNITVDTFVENVMERMALEKHMELPAYKEIYRRLKEGGGSHAKNIDDNAQGLFVALNGLVPDQELMIIRAGQESSQMYEGLNDAAFVAESARKLKNAVIFPLFYIVLLLGLLVGIIFIAKKYILNIFELLVPINQWPPISAAFRSVVIFFSDNWLLLVIIGILFAVISSYSLSRWSQKAWNFRQWFDRHIPPWSVYKLYQSSSFMLAISMASKAGPIDTALKRYSEHTFPWMRRHVGMMTQQAVEGISPAEYLTSTDLFDNEINGDVRDYGKAGVLTDAIDNIARDILEQTILKVGLKAQTFKVIMIALIVAMMIWMLASLSFLSLFLYFSALSNSY